MNGLVGSGALARLALRRDRIVLPVWTVIFVLMAASSSSATASLYPSTADRVQAAAVANGSTSLLAMYGPVFRPTLGALSMIKMTAFGALMVAILAMTMLIRHTRAEEEAGRLELLGATVVGRFAPLTAALLVAVGGNVLLGLLTMLSLAGTGLPAAGSVVFGLGWAGAGISFAAVAAVMAQLTSSARTATALSGTALAGAYLLRAVGDTAGPGGPSWASWLSPIGWVQQARPYAGERWWVLLLPLGFAAVLGTLAYRLNARRDLAAGLLADRPGDPAAAPWLRSSLALAWRLHRGLLLGWTLGFALLGTVLGSVTGNVGQLLDSPQARDLITRLGGSEGLTNAFLAAELGFGAVFASVYGIQAALRLRSEEVTGHAESLLATAVTRTRWLFSHLAIALAGSVVLLAVLGLGAGVASGIQQHDGSQVGRLIGAALVHLPAVWVLVGLAIAGFGLLPRAASIAWVFLVGFLLVAEFGPLFSVSQWVLDVSPYAHVPKLPGASLTVTPLLWLLAVAAALVSAGMLGFRRRDVG